ncbi:tetratricopeptide repeat protein [Rubrivirga sp.]|uniref:tetratricopeptide repeat protein n=1 Tax=Rubrivirga sp. TaxID=1885344 RepID=UPI003B52F3BC
MTRPLLLLLAALCLLPLAGCDETASLLSVDEGVEVAVEDAVLARDRGDFAQAVDLLERAHDAEPENAVVRVELATTLLQRDGIDLIDLDRIGQFLTTAGGERPSAPAARGGSCSVATDPSAQAFDPADVAGFDDLVAASATLAEASDLLDGVLPAVLTSFDLCTTVVDGALSYDRDGALADLAARGLTRDQMAQALAVSALTTFVEAYVFVAEALPETTTWYRLADGSVAICAEDEAALQAQAEGPIRGIGQALLALDARAALLGSGSVAAEIVGTALDVYNDLQDAVADYCSV